MFEGLRQVSPGNYAWQKGLMANKTKLERLERRVDGFYTFCEKVVLRTILFGCFIVEVGRFVIWLLR
jgi:hypothetical protein